MDLRDESTGASVWIEVAACTDIGHLRGHNEDSFLVLRIDDGAREAEALRRHALGARGTLLVVCDGMGGAAAGEVASRIAIESIAGAVLAAPAPVKGDLVANARWLRSAVERANEAIFAAAAKEPDRAGMGTTLTAVLIHDGYALFAQVGDSRAYLARAGQLILMTRDQSLVNSLLESGQITGEEAETFSYSNIILQALGVSRPLDVHLSKVALQGGDRLLVCSDGLTCVCPDEEIASVVADGDDLSRIATALIDMANVAGGPDNITAVLARVEMATPPTTNDDSVRYERWEVTDESAALAPTPPAGTRIPTSTRVTPDAMEPDAVADPGRAVDNEPGRPRSLASAAIDVIGRLLRRLANGTES